MSENIYLASECHTVGGNHPNVDCVFPFKYGGFTYNNNLCPTVGSADGLPWCSTMTDDEGVHLDGNWGHCSDGCKAKDENWDHCLICIRVCQ